MQPLIIQPTASTPSINFDFENRKFEITGCSTSSDTVKFYEQVHAWQKEFHRYMKTKMDSGERKRHSFLFDFKIDLLRKSFQFKIIYSAYQLHP